MGKASLKARKSSTAGIEDAITFEFSYFMSPQSAYLHAGHLYNRYMEYLNEQNCTDGIIYPLLGAIVLYGYNQC